MLLTTLVCSHLSLLLLVLRENHNYRRSGACFHKRHHLRAVRFFLLKRKCLNQDGLIVFHEQEYFATETTV